MQIVILSYYKLEVSSIIVPYILGNLSDDLSEKILIMLCHPKNNHSLTHAQSFFCPVDAPVRIFGMSISSKLGCFRRNHRGIVIALASSAAAASSSAAASCENFDIF